MVAGISSSDSESSEESDESSHVDESNSLSSFETEWHKIKLCRPSGNIVHCFLTGMMNFNGTRLKLDCKNCVKILASKGKQLIYTGLNGRALLVLI